MNENQLTVEYKFDNPLIQKMDSLIDNSLRDCHNLYCHPFDHICGYDLYFTTNIGNSETVNFTISDKSMASYELNKKLPTDCGNGFKYYQINKLTIKFYSNLSRINIHYYLKLQIPIMHRHFLRKISQSPEYKQTNCNDRRSPFHFACRQRNSYINPQF